MFESSSVLHSLGGGLLHRTFMCLSPVSVLLHQELFVCNSVSRTSNCSLSGSCCDDKENLPSSTEGTTTTANQSPPGENLPASSALGNNGESSSRVLGKRRGSESIEQEFGVQYCSSDCNGAVKKQRVDHQVSVSVISCEQLPASHHLDSAAQSDARDSPSSNNPPLKTDSCFVTNGTGSIAAVSNSKDFVSGSTSHDVVGYSQNSVGRDIAAEFDSLFSPEILLTLDNDPQLGVGSCNTLPSTTVTNSVAQSTQASTTSTYTTSLPPRSSSNAPAVSSVAGAETEHPLPSACERTTCNEMVVGDENGLMLGLFGGVAFENLSRPNSSNGRPEGTPTVEPNAPGARGEEEDVGLQRAMEESLREQVGGNLFSVVLCAYLMFLCIFHTFVLVALLLLCCVVTCTISAVLYYP